MREAGIPQTEVCATGSIMEAVRKARQETFLRKFAVNQGRTAGLEQPSRLRKKVGGLSQNRGRDAGALLRRQLAVELHDFQSHFGGSVHVFNVKPFLDRVDGPHARAEIGALDSLAIENVRVAAAA